MRLTLLAVSALAFAACSESKPAETPAAKAPAVETPAAPAHDMSSMDDTMKSADAADDANTAETTDGFTFHTIGGKIESVHLPTAAGVTWTASTTDTSLVDIGEAKDEAMPDGSMHHIVKVTPKTSGNAVVKFEKRQGDAATPVVETRNINFMVH